MQFKKTKHHRLSLMLSGILIFTSVAAPLPMAYTATKPTVKTTTKPTTKPTTVKPTTPPKKTEASKPTEVVATLNDVKSAASEFSRENYAALKTPESQKPVPYYLAMYEILKWVDTRITKENVLAMAFDLKLESDPNRDYHKAITPNELKVLADKVRDYHFYKVVQIQEVKPLYNNLLEVRFTNLKASGKSLFPKDLMTVKSGDAAIQIQSLYWKDDMTVLVRTEPMKHTIDYKFAVAGTTNPLMFKPFKGFGKEYIRGPVIKLTEAKMIMTNQLQLTFDAPYPLETAIAEDSDFYLLGDNAEDKYYDVLGQVKQTGPNTVVIRYPVEKRAYMNIKIPQMMDFMGNVMETKDTSIKFMSYFNNEYRGDDSGPKLKSATAVSNNQIQLDFETKVPLDPASVENPYNYEISYVYGKGHCIAVVESAKLLDEDSILVQTTKQSDKTRYKIEAIQIKSQDQLKVSKYNNSAVYEAKAPKDDYGLVVKNILVPDATHIKIYFDEKSSVIRGYGQYFNPVKVFTDPDRNNTLYISNVTYENDSALILTTGQMCGNGMTLDVSEVLNDQLEHVMDKNNLLAFKGYGPPDWVPPTASVFYSNSNSCQLILKDDNRIDSKSAGLINNYRIDNATITSVSTGGNMVYIYYYLNPGVDPKKTPTGALYMKGVKDMYGNYSSEFQYVGEVKFN